MRFMTMHVIVNVTCKGLGFNLLLIVIDYLTVYAILFLLLENCLSVLWSHVKKQTNIQYCEA